MAQNRRRLYVHKINANGEESFRKVVDVATVTRRHANVFTFEEGGELTFFRQKEPLLRHARGSGHPEKARRDWIPVFTGMTEEAWPVRILRRGAEKWCR